jgi:hypothetical protein
LPALSRLLVLFTHSLYLISGTNAADMTDSEETIRLLTALAERHYTNVSSIEEAAKTPYVPCQTLFLTRSFPASSKLEQDLKPVGCAFEKTC